MQGARKLESEVVGNDFGLLRVVAVIRIFWVSSFVVGLYVCRKNLLGSTRALCARNFDFDLCTHSLPYLATWSINILTFMTTLCSIFFLTFNILS